MFYDKVELSEREEKDYQRLLSLMNRCSIVNVFEFEGVLFFGDYIAACKTFCEQTNYPADFYVWLTNNYKRVSSLTARS